MGQVSTTDDAVYRGKVLLCQPAEGYRFGSDSMLLASAVPATYGQSVLELGCGVGAVMLAASYRLPEVYFTGIEREPVYAALAEKNIVTNDMQDRVKVQVGDLCERDLLVDMKEQFDHIIANPPYFSNDSHTSSANDLRRVARQADPGAIAQWVQAANRYLKPEGTVTFIYPEKQAQELIDALSQFTGNIMVLPLLPKEGVPAKRLLIQATKGVRGETRYLQGLVLHEADGAHTDYAEALINGVLGLKFGA